MQFSVYQESRIGGRKVNQDRMGYIYTRDSLLLLLADGMGGHIRGEMAAAISLQAISNLFQQNATPYIRKPEDFLEEAFLVAHREIQRYAQNNFLPETPRTTIVACLIQHGNAVWAHCGDSRLYWIRDGQILACTQDHSRIAALMAQGMLDPNRPETHPDRNKLFNCLGSTNLPIVETSRRASLHAGDSLLLCSDGLWSALSDQIIAKRLQANTIMRSVPEMLDAAISFAGTEADNATALAITWLGENSLEDTTTVTTKTLQLGAVTSMIPTQPLGESEDERIFNEYEIEKTIAEIRNAIQKTSSE